MKFISFNINGLRARPHQLEAIIERYQPDVIGLQEIKVADEAFPYEITENLGYHVFHHGQKGHYGVALLTNKNLKRFVVVFQQTMKMRKNALLWQI